DSRDTRPAARPRTGGSRPPGHTGSVYRPDESTACISFCVLLIGGLSLRQTGVAEIDRPVVAIYFEPDAARAGPLESGGDRRGAELLERVLDTASRASSSYGFSQYPEWSPMNVDGLT